ncbi:Hsp20/alpha crystallin family protein [Candidatus Parcubacteria bacterium]|nr:Hsp20/alpha crystallin family protein [Candidatus Parcubacteria bacterium]
MSFLEKLKKNIGIEEKPSLIKDSALPSEAPLKVERKMESEEKPKSKKKKVKIKEEIKTEIKKEEKPAFASASKEKWFEQKGELAVDVYQTKTDLVIQSAVAGVKPENLDIVIENDILTIEGNREKPDEDEEKNYFYQECYWGPFSKRIILQEEVDNSRVEAMMKDGILTIRIPKIQRKRKRKVAIKT